MSNTGASSAPFNKADASPQSIQRVLDENSQLIKALVENMTNKGKSMECIQYQQTLHKNLVFLAGLADPNLNIQALIPSPGSSSLGPPTTSPQTSTATSGGGSSPSSTPAVASSGASQPPVRQPQATGINPPSTSPDTNWSANSQSARATPPSTMSAGQFPSGGGMQNFEGGMWNSPGHPQAQQGMYNIQPQGSGFGGMMSPEDRQRQQQILRMRQEQMIQAQQMRRMQMQQQQQQQGGPGSGPPGGGGGMFPGMMPSQSGMPPGYPQSNMMQMPPGPMNMH